MKRTPLTLAVAIVLLVIFGLMLFVYQVRLSEVAVVTFFGKIAQVKTTPGPGLRLPYPIEQVYDLDQRIQNFEVGDKFEEIVLADQNIILLSVYVGYQISDPTNFFLQWNYGSIATAERSLGDVVRSSKNEVAGRHKFPEFISADPQQMKFTQIEQEILAEVQKRVNEKHFGVDIKFVHIQKIGLPESVTQNVFDRMTSDRQFYIAKIQSDGEFQSNQIRSVADSTASKLLSDADAQALTIRGEGEAQMMTNLAVLQQNPGLATFNMQIAAMEQFLQKKTTLVLDLSTSPLQWLKMDEPSKKDQ
jgi:modulator of FtsH protease HflC